ncbi:hypothetical protein CTI12_AA595690 [Artemisia annua]|uniref:Uncharacterized protein n=1 Tax=Artemisia annua TaxID=35608 RepID=A0A2U1KJJ4_ARTAN|nr:hypothetical protein CTI12_AA595690 [Artemisia annua]
MKTSKGQFIPTGNNIDHRKIQPPNTTKKIGRSVVSFIKQQKWYECFTRYVYILSEIYVSNTEDVNCYDGLKMKENNDMSHNHTNLLHQSNTFIPIKNSNTHIQPPSTIRDKIRWVLRVHETFMNFCNVHERYVYGLARPLLQKPTARTKPDDTYTKRRKT